MTTNVAAEGARDRGATAAGCRGGGGDRGGAAVTTITNYLCLLLNCTIAITIKRLYCY